MLITKEQMFEFGVLSLVQQEGTSSHFVLYTPDGAPQDGPFSIIHYDNKPIGGELFPYCDYIRSGVNRAIAREIVGSLFDGFMGYVQDLNQKQPWYTDPEDDPEDYDMFVRHPVQAALSSALHQNDPYRMARAFEAELDRTDADMDLIRLCETALTRKLMLLEQHGRSLAADVARSIENERVRRSQMLSQKFTLFRRNVAEAVPSGKLSPC